MAALALVRPRWPPVSDGKLCRTRQDSDPPPWTPGLTPGRPARRADPRRLPLQGRGRGSGPSLLCRNAKSPPAVRSAGAVPVWQSTASLPADGAEERVCGRLKSAAGNGIPALRGSESAVRDGGLSRGPRALPSRRRSRAAKRDDCSGCRLRVDHRFSGWGGIRHAPPAVTSLAIRVSVLLFVCLSSSVCLSAWLSVCLPLTLSVGLSVCLKNPHAR